MGTECKCSGSSGGGTKCPDRHIAICIQGKDGGCYGQCIPIPSQFGYDSIDFQGWLKQIIQRETSRYGENFGSVDYNYFFY